MAVRLNEDTSVLEGRAEEARRLAAIESDPVIKDWLTQVATEYQRLFMRAKRTAAVIAEGGKSD